MNIFKPIKSFFSALENIVIEVEKEAQKVEQENERIRNDPETISRQYELDVGLEIEFNEELVIYNNLVREVNESGIDLASTPIYSNKNIVRCIKCFNHKNMNLSVKDIYDSLTPSKLNIFRLSGRDIYKAAQVDVADGYMSTSVRSYEARICSKCNISFDNSVKNIDSIISNIKHNHNDYHFEKVIYVEALEQFDNIDMLVDHLGTNVYMYKDMTINVFQCTDTQQEKNHRINSLRDGRSELPGNYLA